VSRVLVGEWVEGRGAAAAHAGAAATGEAEAD
jgi:hypothetical protein